MFLKEIEEQLNELLDRILEVSGGFFLLKEYMELDETSLFYQNYSDLVDAIYSRLDNELLISVCTLFDDKSNDAITLKKTKNSICKLLRENGDLDNAHKLKQKCDEVLNHSLIKIIDNICEIRNKNGLAHGNKKSYSILIDYEDLEKLINAIQIYYNLLCEYYDGKIFVFKMPLKKTKSLTDLVNEYQKIK